MSLLYFANDSSLYDNNDLMKIHKKQRALPRPLLAYSHMLGCFFSGFFSNGLRHFFARFCQHLGNHIPMGHHAGDALG